MIPPEKHLQQTLTLLFGEMSQECPVGQHQINFKEEEGSDSEGGWDAERDAGVERTVVRWREETFTHVNQTRTNKDSGKSFTKDPFCGNLVKNQVFISIFQGNVLFKFV